jgi:hypothetical protein
MIFEIQDVAGIRFGKRALQPELHFAQAGCAATVTSLEPGGRAPGVTRELAGTGRDRFDRLQLVEMPRELFIARMPAKPRNLFP